MRKEKPLSLQPSTKLVSKDRDPYAKHYEDMAAQIDTLQALLTAERLKSAKLAFQLQLAQSSQAA